MGNIIMGIIFIAGGLSGYLGIRFIPNSQYGLVAIGVGLLVWGAIQMRSGSDED